MMFYSMQNSKMPSMRTVRIFLAASTVLALLSGLMPSSLVFPMLALCFSSVALLSIPKMTYPRILLLLAAMTAIAVAAVLLLTRDPSACFAAASFAPAAALLTLTIRKRCSRTCGIILAAIGMGIFYLAGYLLAIYLTYHRFSLALFKELYASLEQTFIATMNNYLESTASAQMIAIDEATLVSAFKQVLALLPGIFAVIMFGTVWLSTVLLRHIFRGYLYGEQRFADWKVTMNRPSAWVFCLSTLLLIFSLFEPSGIMASVLINLLLILLPGFLCVGCSAWRAKLARPGRRTPFGAMPIILILVMLGLFFSPILPIYLIALSGATGLIAPRVKANGSDHTP